MLGIYHFFHVPLNEHLQQKLTTEEDRPSNGLKNIVSTPFNTDMQDNIPKLPSTYESIDKFPYILQLWILKKDFVWLYNSSKKNKLLTTKSQHVHREINDNQ